MQTQIQGAVLRLFLQIIWGMFALTWDLAFTGLITIKAEECLYMMCDFGAKVSAFTGLIITMEEGCLYMVCEIGPGKAPTLIIRLLNNESASHALFGKQ